MRKALTSLLLAALFCLPTVAHAGVHTLTINDGTSTSAAAPLDFYNADYYYCRSQMYIYQEDISAMVGKVIKSITFYSTATGSLDRPNLRICVKMGVVSSEDNDYFDNYSPEWDNTTERTAVHYAGVSLVDGKVTLTFEVGFYYPGGTLFLQFENMNSDGSYMGNSSGWYGVINPLVESNTVSASTLYGKVSKSGNSYPATIHDKHISAFSPKMTFTYWDKNTDYFSNCYGSGYSYNCTFESDYDRSGWFTSNYNSTAPNPSWFCQNVWRIGDNLSCGVGNYSLYTSAWNSNNNSYLNDQFSYNFACTYVKLYSGTYAVDYDWRCAGEYTKDYMRVVLLPWTDANIAMIVNNASTLWVGTVPDDAITLDTWGGLSGQSTWQHHSTSVELGNTNEYILVVYWHSNDNGGSQPPAAIDNIRIVRSFTVPYTCDFEDGNTRYGWDSEFQGDSPYFTINNDVAHGGAKSLYLYNDGYGYNYGSEARTYAYTAIDVPQSGQYDLSYWWRCIGENNYDFARLALVPTDVAFAFGHQMPTDSRIIFLNEGKLSGEDAWTHYQSTKTIPQGKYYLMAYWENDISGSNGDPIAIDDISITAHQETQGIDEVENTAVRLYPNPATKQVVVSFGGDKAQVELVDLNGRMVLTQQANGGEATIGLVDVVAGVYFVRLVSGNNTSVQKLVVK